MAKVTAPVSSKPAASAKPTASAPEKKVTKTKRADHPLIGSKDTTKFPFVEVPADYSFTAHKPLKKKAFTSEAAFFEYKAKEMEAKAADFRAKAETSKLTGDGKGKQKVKRLLKMQEKMQELQKQLAEQGLDVEKLIAAQQAAKAATQAAQA